MSGPITQRQAEQYRSALNRLVKALDREYIERPRSINVTEALDRARPLVARLRDPLEPKR